MIMTTTTTLTLAALAALSLGVGTARAQDGGDGGPDYLSRPTIEAAIKAAKNYNGVSARPRTQFGSSDVRVREYRSDHSATSILSNQLDSTRGVGG
jgi:hypothetical protein